MSIVELRFSALPSHVRTARLAAAAVARRAGVEEHVLDEVRLAVGEACSRAVGLHRRSRPDEPVTVTLIHEADRFSIEVSDRVPSSHDPESVGVDPSSAVSGGLDALSAAASAEGGFSSSRPGRRADTTALTGAGSVPGPALGRDPVVTEEEDHIPDEADALLSGSMGLALISGLVDDLDVRVGADGAVIRMSWPAGTNAGKDTGSAQAGTDRPGTDRPGTDKGGWDDGT